MGELRGLTLPKLSPIPARRAVYFATLATDEVILSKLSPTSTRTQEANWRIFVLTPAITGVGKLILKVEK